MARVLRVAYPGAIYHAMARGNARQAIFRDDRDRERFLRNLEEAVAVHGVRLYLFVLMPNHVHLLLETPHANISAFMQGLLSGYTSYVNRRHRSVGHLFQGRFKAKLVRGDEYLLKLSRYIHLNPVAWKKAQGLPLRERMRRLRAWRWSSFPGYAGLAERLPFVDYAPLLAMAAPWVKGISGGDGPGSAGVPPAVPGAARMAAPPGLLALCRAYRRFVETGLAHSDDGFRRVYAASALAIGDERFVAEVEHQYGQLARASAHPEDIALRHRAARLDADTVLRTVAAHFALTPEELEQRGSETLARAAAAWLLRRQAGMPFRQAAARLGWGSGAAAGVQVWRMLALARQDDAVAAELAGLEALLIKMKGE